MKEKEIGVVTHYFGNISVAIIQLKSRLKVSDTIHITGAHDDLTQEVSSMQIEHESIEQAGKGDFVGIKVKSKVHPNDKVYLVQQ